MRNLMQEVSHHCRDLFDERCKSLMLFRFDTETGHRKSLARVVLANLRQVQLGVLTGLITATLILPPGLMPDVITANTTAYADTIIGPDPGTGDPCARDSDMDGENDCIDPCPLTPGVCSTPYVGSDACWAISMILNLVAVQVILVSLRYPKLGKITGRVGLAVVAVAIGFGIYCYILHEA
ncbi:MAG: hypothetical protein OXG25_08480 [Gammaproteobacteria bacterium]|nr:hypothetical protein [Gammaproteobacteria bacterium]